MPSMCLAVLGWGWKVEADRLVGASKSWNKIGHDLGTVAAGWGGLIIASLYPCVFEVSHQEKLKSNTGDFTQHLCGPGSRVHVGNSLPLLSPLT